MPNPPAGAQTNVQFAVVNGQLAYFDGTAWQTIASGGGTIHTSAPLSGDGSVGTPATIAAGAVPLTALAVEAANTFVANGTGGSASPTAITAAAAAALLPAATSSAAGLMSAALFTATQNVGEYHLDCDVTTTGDKGVIVPAQVGRTFIISRFSQMVLAITGTCTTAPTLSIGVSSAFTNWILGPSAVQANAAINIGVGSTGNVSPTGSYAALVTNSDLHVATIGAVVGCTVLSVRISVFGYWTNF